MNIVIIGPVYPLRGGIAHSTALLAKYLSRNHTVSLISFKRQYPSLLFPGKTQFESEAEGVLDPSVHIIDSINPLTWWKAGRRLRALAPDCIIVKYWMPFFAPCYSVTCRLARIKRRTRIIYLCDNIFPHEKRLGDTLLNKLAFSGADNAIVLSSAVEQELLRVTHNVPYRLVPHPVYESFGERIPKEEARRRLKLEDQRVILFFGFIRGYKGLEVLLEAMPRVLGTMKVRLLIAGEFYEREDDYRRMIRTLGIEESVTICSEYIPQPEVPAYFSASDVVVLPYHTATQSGIVQIAFNFNTPVITTNVGGLAEVVTDGFTGFIVPPGDPAALADAITRFYRNSCEKEFVEHIKTDKRRFSWEAMVDAIEELAASGKSRC